MAVSLLLTAWCAFALAVAAGCLVLADRLPSWLPNDKLLHQRPCAVLALPVAAMTSTAGRSPRSGDPAADRPSHRDRPALRSGAVLLRARPDDQCGGRADRHIAWPGGSNIKELLPVDG